MLETLISYKEYQEIVRDEWKKYGKKEFAGMVCDECNRKHKKDGEISLRFPPNYNGVCPRCKGALRFSGCSL